MILNMQYEDYNLFLMQDGDLFGRCFFYLFFM